MQTIILSCKNCLQMIIFLLVKCYKTNVCTPMHWKLSNNTKNLSFKFDNLHLWSMNEISRLDIKILLVIYKHFHQTIKCYIWLCVTTFVKHFSKNAYLQKIQCIETKTTFAAWFFASWQNSLQNVSSKKLEGKFELAIAQTHGECLH